MSVSNNVFRFLQTSSSYVEQTNDVVLEVTLPTTAVIADFIDKTLVLTATASNNNSVSQQQEQADLANYVLKTGSIITGTLSMEGNSSIIFPDGSQQFIAYSNANDSTLNQVASNTQYINTNGKDTKFKVLQF